MTSIAAEGDVELTELVDLYDAVGWTAYTRDPAGLLRALRGSHLVLAARDDDGRLIGLARTVSDGETICYVQDLLVHPDAQRQRIGSRLITELRDRYRQCRLLVLTTDLTDDLAQGFYRSNGLVPHAELGLIAFSAQ